MLVQLTWLISDGASVVDHRTTLTSTEGADHHQLHFNTITFAESQLFWFLGVKVVQCPHLERKSCFGNLESSYNNKLTMVTALPPTPAQNGAFPKECPCLQLVHLPHATASYAAVAAQISSSVPRFYTASASLLVTTAYICNSSLYLTHPGLDIELWVNSVCVLYSPSLVITVDKRTAYTQPQWHIHNFLVYACTACFEDSGNFLE